MPFAIQELASLGGAVSPLPERCFKMLKLQKIQKLKKRLVHHYLGLIRQEFRSKMIAAMYPEKQKRVVGSIFKVKNNFQRSISK